MTTTLELDTDRIATALASSRAAVRQENGAAWQLQSTVVERVIRLRADDDWLLFEAALDGTGCAAVGQDGFLPARLMRWNATLPGGAKFAMDDQFNLTVRAQAPLLEDVDPGPRLLEGWSGIEAGLQRFHAAQEKTPAPSAATAPDLRALAAGTGWAFTERQDGGLAFELSSQDSSMMAAMHETVHGGVRAWVRLASLEELPAVSRDALAVLLLRAGSVLRLARPAFAPDDGRTSACLEVVFDTAPAGDELRLALESLAVGVTLAAREAKFLCDEQTAREYLTVGKWIPREQGDDKNKQQPTVRTR